MNEIQKLAGAIPDTLCGDWIKKKSYYEKELCKEVGWIETQNRYYDATYNNLKIEIKKGNSIWLDLVRYSEILCGEGPTDTLTAFFVPLKGKISKIYFVQTAEIIKKLNLSKEIARHLKRIKKLMPHSLNAQASLTLKDIREMACHWKDCE